MTQVLTYLPRVFVRNITDFLNHWYVQSFKRTSHNMLNLFEELDRIFALRVNLKNLWKPLYQDRTAIGYIIGFIFRSIRIFFTSILYLAIFFISLALYLAWLLIPPFLVYQAITP